MITANIVIKNEEEYIERCLSQVMKLADEVLLIDTGSTDRTPEIVSTFPIMLLHGTGEISDLRNLLLLKSKGDWIWFVDGDEIWPDEELDKLRKKLEETKAKALSFSFVHFVGDEDHAANHNSESVKFVRNTHDLQIVKKFPFEVLIDSNGHISAKKAAGRNDVEFCKDIKFLHYGGIKKNQWRGEQYKNKKFQHGYPIKK